MTSLIIDTDAGVDDLLAIAFLLTQQSVTIEAITVVNGLAHVPAGARNVLRLLEVAGNPDIPVYMGAKKPMPGGTDFPEVWRRTADELPGVALPSASGEPRPDAVDFLAKRFASSPFTLLALGPHTNLATALALTGGGSSAVTSMTMMGGAVSVPGNVDQDGNRTAEWNMFEDPAAASAVFASKMPIAMVPLDATQDVPIDEQFLEAASELKSPLGKIVFQLLTLGYDSNDQDYFAWDPLAGMSVVLPQVVKSSTQGITLVTARPNAGQTKSDPSSASQVDVATRAQADLFESTFLDAF